MLLFFSKEVKIVFALIFLSMINLKISPKVKQIVKVMRVFEEKVLSLHIKNRMITYYEYLL